VTALQAAYRAELAAGRGHDEAVTALARRFRLDPGTVVRGLRRADRRDERDAA
jgi:hypothetical protein